MTDKEKLAKLSALEEITSTIGGCFGEADKIFAKHKYDEDRAKKLRNWQKKIMSLY